MKKFGMIILAVIVIVTSIACLTACSDNTSDFEYITDKGELIIGVTDFEPMNYKDADGNWIGFDTEFAEAVCAEMGLTPVFQEIDWDSKEIELSSKTIDCIWNGFTVTDERLENMDFTSSYMMNKQVVVIDKSNASTYTTLESLKDASLAAEGGSAGQDAIEDDEYLSQATFNSMGAQTDVLLELTGKTSDAGVMDYVMAMSYVGEGDYANLMIVEDISLAYEEYAVGFRKDSDMDEEVNKAMVTLYNNGTLTELATQYDIAVIQLMEIAE
jgi:polar amino acid transport system substrate-binding protein